MAAATDYRRVQTPDVKNGVELMFGGRNICENAACVRFVDEQRSGNGLKLITAAGPRIDGWTLEAPGEKDVFDSDRFTIANDKIGKRDCGLGFGRVEVLAWQENSS